MPDGDFHIPDSELTERQRAIRAAYEALRKIREFIGKAEVAVSELERLQEHNETNNHG